MPACSRPGGCVQPDWCSRHGACANSAVAPASAAALRVQIVPVGAPAKAEK